MEVAARLARLRRGHVLVVYKESGVPAISDLWRECGDAALGAHGVEHTFCDIDYAAYRTVHDPDRLDVVVAPNLFGDVLADLAAVLLGSRALAYSGTFSEDGDAVYQTNHGAAYDLAGTGRANPVGQIRALAMLLRESLRLPELSLRIEQAIDSVWKSGGRTEDLARNGEQVIGTCEMAHQIAEALRSGGRA
jgi:3-isopropylmalate dehydrogenase